MEMRGEQETVNMMLFNQVMLHGRLLKVNRPSDFRAEIHHPGAAFPPPDRIEAAAVVALCEKLDGLAAPPPAVLSLASQAEAERNVGDDLRPSADLAGSGRDAPVEAGSGGVPPPSGGEMEPDVQRDFERAPAGSEEFVKVEVKEEVVNAEIKRSEEGKDVSNGEKENKNSGGEEEMKSKMEVVVISLRNLVKDEDLNGSDENYLELKEDIESECGRYGIVRDVNIPRDGPWMGTAFVQFEHSEGAGEAISALAKRVFDGTKIIVVGIEGCSTADEAASRSAV